MTEMALFFPVYHFICHSARLLKLYHIATWEKARSILKFTRCVQPENIKCFQYFVISHKKICLEEMVCYSAVSN